MEVYNLKPIAIDLFCGAGGMSEGIIRAGFDIVFSNDINEQVVETYTTRHEMLGYKEGHNTHFECEDIRKVNGEKIFGAINQLKVYSGRKIKEVDAIFGGPPCQGFSRAGKRQVNDPRNMLFKEYIRIIKEINPKYIVMENVEGMLDMILYDFESIDGEIYPEGKVVDIVQKELDKIEYNYLKPQVLKASQYGVPQKRKRLIFLGYRKDMQKPQYPKKEQHEVTVKEAFEGLYGEKVMSTYAKERNPKKIKEIKNREESKHDAVIKERFSLFNQGETQRQTRKRLTEKGVDLSGKKELVNLLKEKRYPKTSAEDIIQKMKIAPMKKEDVDVILTKKNSRTRLSNETVSPTILTSSDDYIHPTENRSLTVREMARIQSFDDDFVFYGKRTTGGKLRKKETPQMTQVGNAVPPILSYKIAKEVMRALRGEK